MIETIAIAVFVGLVGILLFLPYLATSWWQSKNRDDGDSEEPETD